MSKKGSRVAAALAVARRVKRADGGGIFDWSGVGEAMPESIGKDQPIRDPLVTIPKRALYDLPRELVDHAREAPLPGLRREDVTDQPEWGAPDPNSIASKVGLNLPSYNANGPYDPLVASSTEMASNLMGTGASFAKPGTAGVFGGKLAQTADHAALARAEQMHAQGAAPEQIHADTGWFQGADGQWRFEIPDENAKFARVHTRTSVDNWPVDRPHETQVGTAFEHPDLYAAYPELKDTSFAVEPMRDMNGYYRRPGTETPGDLIPPPEEKIALGQRDTRYGADKDQSRSTMLHELQHAVQQREGFAPGSSPQAMQHVAQPVQDARALSMMRADGLPPDQAIETFRRINGRDPHPAASSLVERLTPEELAKVETNPYELYRRVAGEVEARNVQWRRNWTPEERARSFPGSTEDIPREKQLIGAPHDPAAPPLATAEETIRPGAAADPGQVGSGGGGPSGAGGLPEAQAAAARWAGERQPLEGLPGALKIGDAHFVPGPIGKVHDVAEAYMREHHPDRPYTPPTKYHPIDKEHSQAIAQAYEEMVHTPNDPATKASYAALIDETAKQYQAIKQTGLKIEPIPAGAEDPYAANPRLAARDVAENNHLWFFPTEGGFGSGEFIKSAAIRHRNGKVYEGPLHSDAYEAAAADTGHDFGKIVSKTRPEDSGFVTSKGRFVSREEAAKIARESKQVPHAQDQLSAEYLPEGYELGPLSDNPMLRKTGEKIGDHELMANDMFRIVHDYFGHLKEGHGFRAAGEDNAWRTHSAMYSDIARPAMTTETRGQNSWVNYGPHGETNRTASAAGTTYADQKVGLMPEWTMRDRNSAAPLVAYHAGPHSFDRFDYSKIGAGEGNQSYGHGLYFAGHEPVSEWYRHQLSTRHDPLLKQYGIQDVGHVIGSHLSDVGGDAAQLAAKYAAERDKLIASGDPAKATTNMIDEYARRIDYLNNPQRATGHMYQVGMDVNPDHLLDYDASFANQTPHVQGRTGPVLEQSIAEQKAAIERLLDKGGTGVNRTWRPFTQHKRQDLEGKLLMLQQAGPAPFKGSDIYQRFGLPAKDRSEAAVKAAQNLRGVDIPGMRYKDAGSRAPGQQGSHNYVMFGDDMLKILRKYGVVGIPAAGVLAADGEERRAMGGKVNSAMQIARKLKRADGGAAFGVLSPAEQAEVDDVEPMAIGRSPDDSPALFKTADPRFNITQQDLDRSIAIGMNAATVGGGGKGAGAARRLVDDTGAAMTIARKAKRYAEPEYTEGGSRIINKGVEGPPDPSVQTVADPHRMMYPGVYRNPRVIAEEAAARVGEEDPAMQRLFGVSRGDLREMAQDRVGNEDPRLHTVKNPRGAVSAQNIQTPQNTQRLQDILAEAGKHEGLRTADAWYIMDPVYRRMVELHGPEAAERYRHLNTLTGMASPGSDVMTEIQRGTGAHWLNAQGRFGDFQKYAGVPEAMRSSQRFPQDMRYLGGHPYHRTSQGEPMAKYLEAGSIQSKNPKVPLYVHASGVPETGFQTSGPVGDAHFSRGVGLSDTRKGPSDVQGSFSTSEYQTLQPWWQHEVAGAVGLESVPAQARLWTALGPQTGVESELGAPKLELLSKQIMEAARRLRVSPETARDMVLSGKAGAGVLAGGILAPGAIEAMREQHASGGKVSNALALARDIKRASGGAVHTGAIMGSTDGRADEVPMEVPDGAYVLTADHCSSMGEGNTMSGFKKLDQMFPKSAHRHAGAAPAKRAQGGAVPIYAADGEYVICPDDITDRWGDLEAGHRYLDAWQTASRKEHVNTLRNLAPPAQD